MLKSIIAVAIGVAAWFLYFQPAPTHAEVVAPYVEASDALRAKLERIHGALESAPVDGPAPGTLDPPLVLDPDGESGNASALMWSELVDGDPPTFDLILSGALGTALAWTAPVRRDDEYDGGDVGFMRRTLDAAFGLRYLVVHRVDAYDPPVAIDGRTFEPGSLGVSGFVVDLESEKVVATYAVSAANSAEVGYVEREDDGDQARALDRFAHSDLWADARTKVAAALFESAGGRVLDEDAQ